MVILRAGRWSSHARTLAACSCELIMARPGELELALGLGTVAAPVRGELRRRWGRGVVGEVFAQVAVNGRRGRRLLRRSWEDGLAGMEVPGFRGRGGVSSGMRWGDKRVCGALHIIS